MQIILYGRPITKKNNPQIVPAGYKNGKKIYKVIPSKQYLRYRKDCLMQITGKYKKNIDYPVNIKCLYYMPTKGTVDLGNLLAATCDILKDAGVIKDDNFKIAESHDGSRVLYDKANPRAEIYIERADNEV